MLFIKAHWIRGVWIRLKVIDSFSLIWVSGWLIFGCSLIEGFLGYILNFGQMSYWGITVMINIVSSLFSSFSFSFLYSIFSLIAELIFCSCSVILNRIFVAHFSFAFVIGFLIFVHIFLLHSFCSTNPLLNSCSSLNLPFFPIFFNDSFVSSIVVSLFFSFFLFFEDIFGICDNLIFANPK